MNENIIPKIEAVLFVASRGMTVKEIAHACGVSEEETQQALSYMAIQKNISENGVWLMENEAVYTLSSSPAMEEYVKKFITDEAAGELTKAQLETLTVIAYKCPITRSDLEHIRGVNCAVIIRILLLRGLITEEDGLLEPVYVLSFAALSHLGISSPKELPNYEELSSHAYIEAAVSVNAVVLDNKAVILTDTEEV